jgi:hypothetical protein
MGCNTHIFLPTDVGPHEVRTVIGILAGLKAERLKFDRSNGTHVRVTGAEEPGGIYSGFETLLFKAPKGDTLVDGDETHFCNFHRMSRRNGHLWNCLTPTSTPFWCAIGRRLVEWFGGVVEFNDCGSAKAPNVFRRARSCPVDRYGLLPDDGKAWETYNDALMKLQPLSRIDLKRGWKVAAYNANYKEDGITEKKEEVQA